MSGRKTFFTEPIFNALAVLLELSHDPKKQRPVPARVIAIGLELSLSYVEKIAADLLKAGLLKSVRGAHGGFMLARPPDTISIADIIDAIKVGPPNKDVRGSLAQVQNLRHRLAGHNRELLAKISLADVKNSDLDKHPAFQKASGDS